MVKTETERILEIQRSYFSLLKDCFREQYDDVLAAGSDSKVGIKNWVQGKTHYEVVYLVKRRLEDLQNFWGRHYKELRESLVALDLLPIYSVSRPLYLKRQIASAGLYVDTVVCHDDGLSGLRNLEILPSAKLPSLSINLLRDYMDLLLLERCFTSTLDVPFAILCPGERDFKPEIEKQIIEHCLNLVTMYSNDLLGARFSSWEDVRANTEKIEGTSAIRSAIKRPDILPAPFKEPKSDTARLSQCFQRMRMLQGQSQLIKPERPNLKDLLASFLTEFIVLEGQVHGSVELDLAPLFPRYTWSLYKWRVEKGNLENSKILGWEERQTSSIATAIQHENLDWLSNIPIDDVIELRGSDFLGDFRHRIRQARKRMALDEGADFTKLAQSVQEDIESAIADHEAKIRELEHEARSRIRSKTKSFLGKISLGIASFWFPPIPIMNMVADAYGYAREIVRNKRLLSNVPERLRRGPWGLLIEAKSRGSHPGA